MCKQIIILSISAESFLVLWVVHQFLLLETEIKVSSVISLALHSQTLPSFHGHLRQHAF